MKRVRKQPKLYTINTADEGTKKKNRPYKKAKKIQPYKEKKGNQQLKKKKKKKKNFLSGTMNSKCSMTFRNMVLTVLKQSSHPCTFEEIFQQCLRRQ